MRPGAACSSASGALCPQSGSYVSLLAASPTLRQHDLCCPVDFLACLLQLQCAATLFVGLGLSRVPLPQHAWPRRRSQPVRAMVPSAEPDRVYNIKYYGALTSSLACL